MAKNVKKVATDVVDEVERKSDSSEFIMMQTISQILCHVLEHKYSHEIDVTPFTNLFVRPSVDISTGDALKHYCFSRLGPYYSEGWPAFP